MDPYTEHLVKDQLRRLQEMSRQSRVVTTPRHGGSRLRRHVLGRTLAGITAAAAVLTLATSPSTTEADAHPSHGSRRASATSED